MQPENATSEWVRRAETTGIMKLPSSMRGEADTWK
jgi:hypothetical protein